MESSDQQRGSIDPLGMQVNQPIPVHDGSLEEANGDGEVGVATPLRTNIHTLLEGSGSFDAWKNHVLSLYDDSSTTLPF